MRAVIQRVARAAVRVGGREVGRIGRGLLVLLCVERGDTEKEIARAARKVVELRCFPDETGRMNRDVASVGGEVLVVSQFTLAADLRRGRRPGFDRAAPPDTARPLYERFVDEVAARGLAVATGEFGAMMEVELVNDGPVTLIYEDRPAPGQG